MDGVGGEDPERQEREESEIVKEPEVREDSSLKRGTSKISRALVCHLMISDQSPYFKLPYFKRGTITIQLPFLNIYHMNISGYTETIQRWEGTLQGKKVEDKRI